MKYKNHFLQSIKLLRFLLYPLYIISFFIPKDKNIWLFGSGHNNFSENSKELFLYISRLKNNDIKAIWISGDFLLVKKLQSQNYNVLYRWSLKGLYVSLRAKYYFYNIYPTDINFYTSGNTTLVNLWHGIPLKHIEFDVKIGPLAKWYHSKWSYSYKFFKPYIFKRPNYILSTSLKTSEIFSSAFRIESSSCLELGYPRNDIFLEKTKQISRDKSLSNLIDRLENLKKLDTKIVIYMPTWRSQNKDFFNDAISSFEQLNHILEKNNIHLYIKPHPMTLKVEGVYSNIDFILPQYDIYPLLSLSDCLITDYSSIYFDYLLLDKEIIFYPFDIEEYLLKERNFYFDYETSTPGKKVYTFEALLEVINKLDQINFSEDRKNLRKLLWKYKDSKASERIFEYFRNL